MTAIEVLAQQTYDAHEWTNKLVDGIPFELWKKTPDTISSNISWQIGHLIISEHYHAILVTVGFKDAIMKTIPMREYGKLYSYDTTPAESVNAIEPGVLREQLTYMQEQVLETIRSFPEEDLEHKVEQPIKMKHPVAVTKFEAISWNIKHTMWHCGQIATLKRLLHGGYDFGLPKKEIR